MPTVLSGPLLIPDPEALRRPVAVALAGIPDTTDPEVDAVVDAVLAAVAATAVPAITEHLERVDQGATGTDRWSRQHRYVTDWQLP